MYIMERVRVASQVRRRLATQALLWFIVSGAIAPVVIQFVYSIYLQLIFRYTGVTLWEEFSIDLGYYFVQWLAVTFPTITLITTAVLVWPRLSNWWFVVGAIAIVAPSVVWLLWVLTSVVALEQSNYVLAISLLSLLLPRLVIPKLWPSAANQPRFGM